LNKMKNDNPLHEEIEEIKKTREWGVSLSRHLLSISRKQSQQFKIMNVNELILKMEKLFRYMIGNKIALKLDLHPQLENIKADPVQINQVIMNLVINARDAMPDGGILMVKTENFIEKRENCSHQPEIRSNFFISISIQDTGVGIDKAVLNHIFEPYFSTKSRRDGNGIGLTTVQEIVKQYNGWIKVQSEPEQGSLFQIFLPSLSATEILNDELQFPKEEQKPVVVVNESHLRSDN